MSVEKSLPDGKMETLRKFTLHYDPVEDRIRLAALLDGDRTVNIWLTQRFLALLVKQLLAWLSNNADRKHETSQPPGARNLFQEFAQGAAMLTGKPEKPVVAAAETGSFLPKGFDISVNERAVTVVFREDTANPDSLSYKVSMDEAVVRRWLQGLFGSYKNAGWSLDVWPEWIREPSAPAAELIKH